MNLRKIIKEELEGFEWIQDIVPDTDLELGQLWLRYDGFGKHNFDYIIRLLEKTYFNDIRVEGDKVYLITDGYCDFTDLFDSRDTSQYGYVNEYLAEKIFCDEDFWEPYYDVVYNWVYQVWEIVENKPELSQYIVKHIEENYMGEEVTDKTIEDGYDERPIDKEYLTWLSNNLSELGDLIDDEDIFSDLKDELRWAYESAYNTASIDEVYNAAIGEIKGVFGDGQWESKVVRKMDGEVTRHEMVFDISSIIIDVINDFFNTCTEGCRTYFDIDRHVEEGETEEEAFENFCTECWDLPSSSFLGMYSYLMSEYGHDTWNPRFSEWPGQKEIEYHFEESVYGRI